jgi:Lambda phage tail tube protein, TTP
MAGGTVSFGTHFKIGVTNPPDTKLLGVKRIAPPNLSRNAIDVTDHDSPGGAMEFIADGVFDPDTLVVTINHQRGSATDTKCRDMFLTTPNCFVEWGENTSTDSENMVSAAVVTSYQVSELDVKGNQTATLTIKLSGELL